MFPKYYSNERNFGPAKVWFSHIWTKSTCKVSDAKLQKGSRSGRTITAVISDSPLVGADTIYPHPWT